MFEQLPASRPLKQDRTLTHKILAGAAIGVILGFGLCSAGLAVDSNASSFLVPTGLFIFSSSGLLLLLTLLWAVVTNVVSALKKH